MVIPVKTRARGKNINASVESIFKEGTAEILQVSGSLLNCINQNASQES